MTLRPVSGAVKRRHAAVDAWAGRLVPAFGRALRSVLGKAQRATDGATRGQAGIVPAEGFNLTDAQDWWSDAVQQEIPGLAADAWGAGWAEATDLRAPDDGDGPLSARRGTDLLLSRLAEVIPTDLRQSVTTALAQSTNPPAARARVTAVLAWDPDRGYWRQEWANAERELDRVLDGYGPPGSSDRAAGRLDPRVTELRAVIREAKYQTGKDRTVWQTHGARASDVVATAAYNAGLVAAYAAEGVDLISWQTEMDQKVREAHREAQGQQVTPGEPFIVGGWPLLYPGDNEGPIWLTINCRCTTLPVR